MAKKEKPTAKKKSPKSYYGSYSFIGSDGKEYRLTKLQKSFADLYLDPTISGTQAAIRAGYKIGSKKAAANIANENLGKLDIIEYINKNLEAVGLNDEEAAKQHLFCMRQFDNLAVKRSAYRDYYELKGKIKGKIEVEAGEKLEGLLDKMSEVINS